jgi:hypothetical protein
MEERSFDDVYDDRMFQLNYGRGATISAAEKPYLSSTKSRVAPIGAQSIFTLPQYPGCRYTGVPPTFQAAVSRGTIGDATDVSSADSTHLRYVTRPSALSSKIGDSRMFMHK